MARFGKGGLLGRTGTWLEQLMEYCGQICDHCGLSLGTRGNSQISPPCHSGGRDIGVPHQRCALIGFCSIYFLSLLTFGSRAKSPKGLNGPQGLFLDLGIIPVFWAQRTILGARDQM